MRPISAVVAITSSFGIGNKGDIPWKIAGKHIPGDIQYFKSQTTMTNDASKINAVVMGRRTWESIPLKFKPLKNRVNIVLTSQQIDLPVGVYCCRSLEEAIQLIDTNPLLDENVEKIVVIGGTKLFEDALYNPACNEYHVTKVEADFECDTYLTPKTVAKLKSLDADTERSCVKYVDEAVEDGLSYKIFVYDPTKATV